MTDVGKSLFCRVTATNAAGSASADSNTVGPVTASGGATTTFDPANKTAAITLSGGNLTATNTAAARGGVRSVASASSGKKYFEVLVTAAAGPAGFVVGLANAANALGSFPGQTADGIGMAMDGTVYVSNSPVGNVASAVVGNRICVAVDLTADKIWFRVNGGNWNNDPTGDPVGGFFPIDMSSVNAGPYFAFVSQNSNADACTANFGGSAYAHTPPAGYGNF